MDVPTKDLMDINETRRRDSQASIESCESDGAFASPMIDSGRRNSIIDQFRDFLSRSVDFSFRIDNPFEKEMY